MNETKIVKVPSPGVNGRIMSTQIQEWCEQNQINAIFLDLEATEVLTAPNSFIWGHKTVWYIADEEQLLWFILKWGR